ncbi:MAG TPA: hypothetical protein VEQ40_11505 [Pyrinomonadaceae bacterium]|nr:hypothetical protein [Pyrinomonadaceae bacterium]
MTEAEEKEIRRIVQNELLGLVTDAQKELGAKDPTGMGRKALEGLAALIRRRQSDGAQGGQ